MRIAQNLKPEKVGQVVVSLPPKRDKEGAVESWAFALARSKLAVKIPVELNGQDDCKLPEAWFDSEAFKLARKETSKKAEALVIPITQKGAETLEAVFELHPASPEEGVPTVHGFWEIFSGDGGEVVLAVNVATLKRAADALGTGSLVLYKLKDGRILAKPCGGHESPRSPVAVMPGLQIQGQLDFDGEEEGGGSFENEGGGE